MALSIRGIIFLAVLFCVGNSSLGLLESDSSPCNCTGSGRFQDETSWRVLSLLLTILCCGCAFVIGSMNPFLCKMSCDGGMKPVKTLAVANGYTKQAMVDYTGMSMMEQMVPEITHHVLSYLDYKSLCCMSMTNIAMKKAANDESAWKSLYHKDWNPEQQSIVPPNGWKAHYAVTKAVVEANGAFYNKFRAKSLRGMGQLWLNTDYVKCIHPGGELISGYDAVMDNWRSVFSWSQRYDFELQDVKVRVSGKMAWVTSKAFVNASVEPLLSTNCYEFHDRQWYVVHHHCSPQLDFAVPDYGMFA